jgi:indole-3-acetate monooxygenase
MVDAASGAWEFACSGNRLTLEQRLDIRLATSNAFATGVRIVDRCFRLGGGGALYDHSPLQRCWRDMHAASHHVVNSDVTMRDYGAVFLGLSEDSLRM